MRANKKDTLWTRKGGGKTHVAWHDSSRVAGSLPDCTSTSTSTVVVVLPEGGPGFSGGKLTWSGVKDVGSKVWSPLIKGKNAGSPLMKPREEERVGRAVLTPDSRGAARTAATSSRPLGEDGEHWAAPGGSPDSGRPLYDASWTATAGSPSGGRNRPGANGTGGGRGAGSSLGGGVRVKGTATDLKALAESGDSGGIIMSRDVLQAKPVAMAPHPPPPRSNKSTQDVEMPTRRYLAVSAESEAKEEDYTSKYMAAENRPPLGHVVTQVGFGRDDLVGRSRRESEVSQRGPEAQSDIRRHRSSLVTKHRSSLTSLGASETGHGDGTEEPRKWGDEDDLGGSDQESQGHGEVEANDGGWVGLNHESGKVRRTDLSRKEEEAMKGGTFGQGSGKSVASLTRTASWKLKFTQGSASADGSFKTSSNEGGVGSIKKWARAVKKSVGNCMLVMCGVGGGDDEKVSPLMMSNLKGHMPRKVIPGRELDEELPWNRNRDVLDHMIMLYAKLISVFGFLGFIMTIFQNEFVFSGLGPEHRYVQIAKSLSSAFSMLCVAVLYRYYWLSVLFDRLRKHVGRGVHLDTQVRFIDVIVQRNFLIELFFCAVHVPPYVTAEIPVPTLGSFLIWRLETFGCMFNSLRVYQLWRVYRNNVVVKLPMRHTVSRFTLLRFGSYFVFRKVLSGWQAVFWMSRAWFLLMFLFAYWYRCSETNACAFGTAADNRCEAYLIEAPEVIASAVPWGMNDLYVESAVWQMFAASTTVGYGDSTPRTHVGRAIACAFGMCGIMITALLTAGLTNALAWTSEEKSALNLCYREKSRRDQIGLAVRLLQLWFRRQRKQKKGATQAEIDDSTPESFWQTKREFARARRATQVEIDDLAGEGLKIEQVYKRIRVAADLLDTMADRLWSNSREALEEEARRQHSISLWKTELMEDENGGDQREDKRELIGSTPLAASAAVGPGKGEEEEMLDLDEEGEWSVDPKGDGDRSHGKKSNTFNETWRKNVKQKAKVKEKEMAKAVDKIHIKRTDLKPFKDALQRTVHRLKQVKNVSPVMEQASKAFYKQNNFKSSIITIGRTMSADLDKHEGVLSDVHEEGPDTPSDHHSAKGSDTRASSMAHSNAANVQRHGGATALPPISIIPTPPVWWRQREMVEERLRTIATALAILAFAGCILTIGINESIIAGASPMAPAVEIIKGVNSILTICMVTLLLRYYWVLAIFRSLSNHLDYCVVLNDVTWQESFLKPQLLVELIVCGCHQVPFWTFTWTTYSMGNIVVYQAETIFALANMWRLYLFWRVIRFKVLWVLPKRHTVARYTSVKFDSIFALKVLLNGDLGSLFIAFIWLSGVVIMAYWYRSSEITACNFPEGLTNATIVGSLVGTGENWQGVHIPISECLRDEARTWIIYGQEVVPLNDLAVSNALWCMFITTATVGYGDYVPQTDCGRFTCALGAIFGIVNAALLTAALCNGIQWTAEEEAAVRLFEREEARANLGPHAASLIILWWRRKRMKVVTNDYYVRLLSARMKFHATKKLALVEMDDCVDHKTRVDQLAKLAKYVEMGCTEVNAKIVDEFDPSNRGTSELVHDLLASAHPMVTSATTSNKAPIVTSSGHWRTQSTDSQDGHAHVHERGQRKSVFASNLKSRLTALSETNIDPLHGINAAHGSKSFSSPEKDAPKTSLDHQHIGSKVPNFKSDRTL